MSTETTSPSEKRALVDFHSHWFPREVAGSEPPSAVSPAMARAWPLLIDLDAQLRLGEEQEGPDVRVLCAPLASLLPVAAGPRQRIVAEVNERLASAVADHSGLLALGTVDVFAGEAGAAQARAALDDLGLRGLVVDCAEGDLLLNAPEARPTLELAAERGVPVFAHPISPADLGARYRAVDGTGILLARGSESALSTLALLRDEVLAELAGLRLAIAGIGAAAVMLAGFLSDPVADPAVSEELELYVDIMGLDPLFARAILAALGPRRVLAGSDWPIMPAPASEEHVTAALAGAGLDDHGLRAVRGANALRLLGIDGPAAGTAGPGDAAPAGPPVDVFNGQDPQHPSEHH